MSGETIKENKDGSFIVIPHGTNFANQVYGQFSSMDEFNVINSADDMHPERISEEECMDTAHFSLGRRLGNFMKRIVSPF